MRRAAGAVKHDMRRMLGSKPPPFDDGKWIAASK